MQKQVDFCDILNEYGEGYITRNNIKGQQRGIIRLLSACRSSALGSHYEKCDQCNYSGKSFNFPLHGTGYVVTDIVPFVNKRTRYNGSINACKSYYL